MTETRLREQICQYGRSLFERGLTPGSSGNISIRLDDGGWLVTPTNASLGFLDPARISRLDASGHLTSGDAPTKEILCIRRFMKPADRHVPLCTCTVLIALHYRCSRRSIPVPRSRP